MLKSLLGNNGAKDRELTDEMRAILEEMRQERARHQSLIEGARGTIERLQELGEPISRTARDVDAMSERLGDMGRRLEDIEALASQVGALEGRTRELTEGHEQARAQLATVFQDSERIRTVFEELSQNLELANSLRDRLEKFLEVEKPFLMLKGDADTLRRQVEGTGEHMVRLREQHERLMDAHKLAMTKMEALDRRREELARDLNDKERRVAGVEPSPFPC